MNQVVSFPRYESYKDSGVEWVGDIPAHWEVERAKWLFKRVDRRVRPEDEIVTAFRDGTVTLRINRRTEGFTNAIEEHGYQGIRKGDLIIHAMDAFAGAIGVSDSDGKSTPVYAACINCGGYYTNNYYYAYLLRYMSKAGYIESLAKGIRERSTDFRFNDFAKLNLPIPPRNEQDRIASFLDQKTAEIDETIYKKLQLIDLLKEMKAILVNKILTQGINSNVPLRNSGLEWLGEIPGHWMVKRLKYVLEERNERSKSGEEPLFMVSQVHGLVVRAEFHEKAEVAQSNIDNKIVHRNDLVFNKLKAHLGVFFKSDIEFHGLVSPDYAVYKSKGLIKNLKFLEYLFRHPAYIEQFIIRATGIVEGLIRLYTGQLFEISVPVPPCSEQEEIIRYIDSESAKFDKIIALQQQQIEKLKEYKVILSSSAVTGKIRVA